MNIGSFIPSYTDEVSGLHCKVVDAVFPVVFIALSILSSTNFNCAEEFFGFSFLLHKIIPNIPKIANIAAKYLSMLGKFFATSSGY